MPPRQGLREAKPRFAHAIVVVAMAALPAWSAAAAPAETAGVVTVFLAPTDTTPALKDTAVRVAAELTAAGFRISPEACAPGLHPGCTRPWPEKASAVAAVGFSWAGDALAIETRVARATDRRAVRLETVVAGGPAHEPSVVAVRATELVRAGVLAVFRGEDRIEDGQAAPRSSAVFVELGPALLQSVDGVGSAWGPLLQIGVDWRRSWFAAAWVMTPTVASDLRASAGSAQLRSDIGGVALGRQWRAGARLRPALALHAGAYHLRVRGKDVAPLTAATDALWTPFAGAGTSLTVALGQRWACHLDARAALVRTSALVRVDGEPAGRVGRPLLLFGVRLGYHP